MRKILAITVFAFFYHFCGYSQNCFTYFTGTDFKANRSNLKVVSLQPGLGSTIWFGLNTTVTTGLTGSGLVRIDGNEWTNWNTGNSYIPDDQVNDIAFEKNGKVWVATDNGVFAFLPGSADQPEIYNTNLGLPENKVTALLISKDDSVFVGFSSGKVYKIYNHIVTKALDFPNQSVNDLAMDKDNYLWIALVANDNNEYGLARYKYTLANYLKNTSCQLITVTTNGSVIFSTMNEVMKYSPDISRFDTLLKASIIGLTCDLHNRVWCTSTNNVYRIDENGAVTFNLNNSGFFPSGASVLAKAPIMADSTGNIWFGYQKTGASLGKVTVNAIASDIIKESEVSMCSGDSVLISASGDFTNFYWDNGVTNNSFYSKIETNYSLTAVNTTSNCYGYDTIATYVRLPYANEKICVVTTYENRYSIIWQRTDGKGTDHYNIYKQKNTAGDYKLIGSVPFDELSVFDDPDTIAGHSEFFAIASVDSCNNESGLSPVHKTLHLTINTGPNGAYNLIWENYEGLQFYSYKIYRGNSEDNLVLIDTVASNITTYTDNPPEGTYYYQIAIVLPGLCDLLKKLKAGAGPYSEAVSNMEKRIKYTNAVDYTNTNSIKVYPTMVTDILNIRITGGHVYNNVALDLTSVNGQCVKQILINQLEGHQSINLPNVLPGLYFLKLSGNNLYFGTKIEIR